MAFGVVGAAFATEDGDELGSFRRNLSIETTGDANPDLTFDLSDRVPRFDFGFNGEAFWIQGGPGISLEDNVAISAAGGGVNVFSGVDGIRQTLFSISNVRDATLRAALQAAGLTRVSIHTLPMAQLDGMEVSNSEFGIIFWGHMRAGEGDGVLSTYCGISPRVAHPGRTLVRDFRLWNIYGEGIFTQYSSQITFRDGLILGDLTSPNPYRGGLNGSGRGYGVDSNADSRAMEYENLHVEGFNRALRVLYDDDSPYEGSRLVGGYFANDRYILGAKNWNSAGSAPFATGFEISGAPTFVPFPGTVNQAPQAGFTSAVIAGLGMSFDGQSSLDPDPPATLELDGNGIASYRWDFGDGTTATGELVVHDFAAPGSYDVTLTVIDCQGAPRSLARTITVAPAVDLNPLLNSDFQDASRFINAYEQESSKRGQGWVGYRWRLESGYARVEGSGAPASLVQVIRDQGVRKGYHALRLELKNSETAWRPNQINVMVYGVNGRFRIDPDSSTGPGPIVALPVQAATLLQTTSLGSRSFDWEAFSWDVDLGQGYEYLIVRILANDVDAGGGDFAGVRDVTLVPTPTPTPMPTPTVADMGLEQVAVGAGQFQYRPTGSPWAFAGAAGIAANGSGFTSGNPPAPEGTQVAFLQATGSISQAVAGWAAGSYRLTFYAAQRGNNGTSRQDFRVLVDGVDVGTFTPLRDVLPGLHDRRLHGRGRVAHDRIPGPGQRRRRQHRLRRPGRGRPFATDADSNTHAHAHADPDRRRHGARAGGGGGRPVPVPADRLALGLRRRRRHLGQRQRLHRRQPAGPGGHPGRLPPEDRLVQPGRRRLGRRHLRADLLRRPAGQHGTSRQDFRVLVDGVVVGTFTPSGTSYQSSRRPRSRSPPGRTPIAFQGLEHRRRRQHRLRRRASPCRPVSVRGRRRGASSRWRWGPASSGTARPARPGPSPAAPASRPTAAASPPATRRPRRAPRSPSSSGPARSARPSPAGPPAPTC